MKKYRFFVKIGDVWQKKEGYLCEGYLYCINESFEFSKTKGRKQLKNLKQ